MLILLWVGLPVPPGQPDYSPDYSRLRLPALTIGLAAGYDTFHLANESAPAGVADESTEDLGIGLGRNGSAKVA
jgi:hypothetical protein